MAAGACSRNFQPRLDLIKQKPQEGQDENIPNQGTQISSDPETGAAQIPEKNTKLNDFATLNKDKPNPAATKQSP